MASIMTNSAGMKARSKMEKKRIRISSKRQITIPQKFYEKLNLTDEVDCVLGDGILVLLPAGDRDNFSVEILKDLVAQGYSGQVLVDEFERLSRQIRPAMKKMIEEADALAAKVTEEYRDRTGDIFGSKE